MDIMKEMEKIILLLEKSIVVQIKKMNMPCARFILIDSCLWTLFIIYYISQFFISKQYKKLTPGHKAYETLLREKDLIIITFMLLAILLYFILFSQKN